MSAAPVAAGRRERKKVETRERLHEAGLELFITNGVAGTTVRDITDRADVAERTFYRHFESKEDLLLDEVRRYFTALAGFVAARPATESPMTSLFAAVSALRVEWTVDDAEVVVLGEFVMTNNAVKGHLHQLVDEHQETLSQIFATRRGLAEPDYHCHLEAAVAGTAFVQSIGRFLIDDGESIWDYGREAIRLFSIGCDPEAAAGIEPLDA